MALLAYLILSSCRYIPYPGGGEKWGGNGVGDDLYSFGFDGAFLCTGKFVGDRSKIWIILQVSPRIGDNCKIQ